MTVSYSSAVAADRHGDTVTALGAGALLRIYNGTKPTNPDTALSGNTLLAELPLPNPVGTVSGKVLTFGVISDETSAPAGGTPTWATCVTSGGTRVLDMTAGVGSGDLNIDAIIIASGTVSVSSGTITTP